MELFQAWLDDLDRHGRSPHTIAAYRRGAEHFADWYQSAYGDTLTIARVMPRDVRDWQAHQQTVERAAPATINQRLVAVSRLLAWCVAQEIITVNPAADIRHIRLAVRQPKSLDKTALRRLLRAARDDVRDMAMIEMLVGTGLRVGEVLALQIGDVDVRERSGRVIVRRSKGGGYREVPLTHDVRMALRHYLDAHPKTDQPRAALWIGRKDAISHRSTVKRMLTKYARLADIAPVHPHTLRHTFATRYLAANPGDVRGLAALLGHTNLNSVMIYTEPGFDDLAERMARAEQMI